MSEADQWLSEFDNALTAGDSEAAAALFHDESFWRDLVAFTWNIKTVEGPDEIRDMLDLTLEHTQPSNWHTTEPPDTADGITTAWIASRPRSAAAAGCCGSRDGKAWTLLTALDELKGHEEPRGPGRPKGVEHGADRDRADVARAAPRGGREARLRGPARGRDRRRRPGRDRARRAAAPARRADDHRRAPRAARRQLAPPLQVAVPARPGLVRPPAVHQVPAELAGVLAQGQDRRLAGDVHAGDGAQLLGPAPRPRAPRTTTTPASGRCRSSARARRSRCGRSSS